MKFRSPGFFSAFLSLFFLSHLISLSIYSATNYVSGNPQDYLDSLRRQTNAAWQPYQFAWKTNVFFDLNYQMWLTNRELWVTNHNAVGTGLRPDVQMEQQWLVTDEQWSSICTSNLMWNLATNNFLNPVEVPPVRPPGNQGRGRYEIKIPPPTTAIRGDIPGGTGDYQVMSMRTSLLQSLQQASDLYSLNLPNLFFHFHDVYERSILIDRGACRTNDHVLMYTSDLSSRAWQVGAITYGKPPSAFPGCQDDCCEGQVLLYYGAQELEAPPPAESIHDRQQFYMMVIDRPGLWRRLGE